MPTPRQSPTNQDPTHDVVFSWEGNKRGFMFRSGAVSLNESPIHAPTRFWTAEQRSTISGRGRVSYSQDPAGFFDSQDLWTMSEGYIFPSLQWQWMKGIRNADFEAPGSVTFKPLLGSSLYIDRSFSASASYSADKAYLLVRRVGTPGTLTVIVASDSGGDPNTTLQTVTKTTTDITDKVSLWVELDWSGTESLTASTTYHIYAYGATTDTVEHHWEVGVNTSGSSSQISANGSSWSAAGYSMYYRVVDADVKRILYDFVLEGAQYVVDNKDTKAASQLWINGDRGTATAGSSTTITDTNKSGSWIADRWIGAKVRVYSGTGDGLVMTITDNTTTVLTFADCGVTLDNTSKYIIYDTDWWTEITGHGFGNVVNRPCVANNIAYFPQGTTAIRRMSVSASTYAFAADGTATADVLASYLTGGKWYVSGISKSDNILDTAEAVTSVTNLTFTAGVAVGGTDFNPTNMQGQDGVLYVWKEDGPYKISGNVVVKMSTGFDALPNRNTGIALCFKDQKMYGSYGGSIVEIQGATTTDIHNYKFGYDGLPNNRRGNCSALVPAVAWLFASMDGGTSNWSSVLCYNGIGWHELTRGYVAGARIRNIFWQSCPESNSRLWININGELIYLKFPFNAAAPLRDTSCTYQHEGVYVGSTVDMNERALYKFASVLRAISENLGNGDIQVDYQLDTDIGSTTWYSSSSFLADSPYDTIDMNLGGIHQIRLRFRIRSTSSTAPPILRSWSLEGNLKAPEKYQWQAVFEFGTDVEDLQGNETKPTQDLAWLKERARRSDKLFVQSTDKAIHEKIVTLESPSRNAEYSDEPGEWFGTVYVTMREV